MKRIFSSDDPDLCRAIAKHPNFTSAELFQAEPDGHKFQPGEERTLVGLVDFPEYNGQTVTISAIRKDGPNGKAYYVRGAINEVANWVYEYRLQ